MCWLKILRRHKPEPIGVSIVLTNRKVYCRRPNRRRKKGRISAPLCIDRYNLKPSGIRLQNQKVTFQRPKTMLIRSQPLHFLKRNTTNLKTFITLLRKLQHYCFHSLLPVTGNTGEFYKLIQKQAINDLKYPIHLANWQRFKTKD